MFDFIHKIWEGSFKPIAKPYKLVVSEPQQSLQVRTKATQTTNYRLFPQQAPISELYPVAKMPHDLREVA